MDRSGGGRVGGPRVLVINLEKREDRRRWMCRSCLPAFSEAGADVSLLQAVDGEEVEAPLAPWWPMDEAGLEATEDRWRELFPDEPLGREAESNVPWSDVLP